jgi:hypothetical protein
MVSLLREILLHVTYGMAGTKACLQPKDRILGIMGIFDERDLEDSGMNPQLPYRGIQDLHTRFTALVLTGSDPNKENWWQWLSLAFTLRKIEGMTSWYICQPYQNLLMTSTLHQYEINKQIMPRCGAEPGPLVLRGHILENIVNVYPEMQQAPDNRLGFSLKPVWIVFKIDLAEWELSIADAVLAVDPMESDRTRDADSEQGIPLDTYWRTLVANITHMGDQPMTIDCDHDFHTACQHMRGFAANHDVVGRYAAFQIFSARKTRTNGM